MVARGDNPSNVNAVGVTVGSGGRRSECLFLLNDRCSAWLARGLRYGEASSSTFFGVSGICPKKDRRLTTFSKILYGCYSSTVSRSFLLGRPKATLKAETAPALSEAQKATPRCNGCKPSTWTYPQCERNNAVTAVESPSMESQIGTERVNISRSQ